MGDQATSRELVAGRYEIVRPLGRGGMGEVLLARQLSLDRLVVLKRVIDARSEQELKALVDEARVAARLHHPNIVSIFDVVDRDGDPVVVMELVLGVSLHELLARAPSGLPIEVALAIAIDLLRGLAFAHTAHVVHRDVNPSNAMVTFAGTTKLIDFGISQWRGEAGLSAGTLGYMAPEQQRGDPVDGRADQYAVGVTLREMLTGGVSSPIASNELASIVARACSDDPDARFGSCTELLLTIEDHLAALGLAATPTHVERWTKKQFGDLRASFDHDVELLPRVRARRPTAQTVVAGADRPVGTRIAFIVRNVGDPGADWLAPVIERLIAKVFRDRGERRFAIASTPDASATRIELGYTCDRGVRIIARRGTTELAVTQAPSVIGCLTELAQILARELGTGLSSRGPDADETTTMARLGATSFDAFLRYQAAIHRYYSTGQPDTSLLAGAVREIVTIDPAWAHPYALLALFEGQVTPSAQATLEAGRVRADAMRDPSGMKLIEAFLAISRGEFEAVYAGLAESAYADETDVLLICTVILLAVTMHRTDEATALIRRLHDDFPELVFGVDLADTFRRAGRAAAAETFVRRWVADAPENLAASVELARIEARLGRTSAAAQHARDALLVHGERGDTLVELFEAMVTSEQFADAQRIVDRMLIGSPLMRARGRYRTAVVAVFDGRFAAAYGSVRLAIEEHRAFGFQSELLQCLELARSLAPMVGDRAAERGFMTELARELADLVGDTAAAAATRYDLALLDRREMPPIDDYLSGLDGAPRDVARRRMLRAAAVAECGSPQKAVAAGFSAFEDNAASLVAFGSCAQRLRELELTCDSFERATHLWSSMLSAQSCPYHAILARFHLAGVRLELGDSAGAREMYASFLRRWSAADRPIPEVAIARKMLAHLA